MNNYYDFLNPNKKKNNPLQGYTNIQSALKEQQALNQSRMNNLFTSKYGVNQNFNPNLGWTGQNVDEAPSWDKERETPGLLEYNKLMGDRFAVANALEQYNLLKDSIDKGKIEANILKEQAEKYIPNQLRLAGLSSSGVSESTLAGVGNQYLKNLSQLDQQYRKGGSSILKDYLAGMADRDVNLAFQLEKLKALDNDDFEFTDGSGEKKDELENKPPINEPKTPTNIPKTEPKPKTDLNTEKPKDNNENYQFVSRFNLKVPEGYLESPEYKDTMLYINTYHNKNAKKDSIVFKQMKKTIERSINNYKQRTNK